MSLISDLDFMLQSLRLAYLRRVDDPAGPRIITFKAPETRDQTEQEDDERSNGHYKASSSLSAMSGLAGFSPPTGWKRKRRRGQAQSRATVDTGSHVDLSGLNNPELWPELEIAHSPEISTPIADFASRRVGGPGGKGLGYSTTIYGPGRTGALGMRVSGKRASVDASNSLRNKFGARSTIDVIDEDSTLREQPAPVGRGSLEVSSASSTPVASRRISAEAKSTGQSDWRAARTERLRNLAEAADAHRQPKPSSLGDSTPSGLSSLAESQSTIGPEGQITAQLAKEGSNPPGVENSESPSSRPIRPPRRTQRPGSSSSISSLQSSGAGSLMPLAASQSSESLTQPAVSAVTSRSRSASEGATTSPVPSLARNGKGFDSLEALDKMSANSGETQEMLSGSMGYNTGYTSAGASSSENEGSDVHLGRRSMQIRMAPADPENEKTPINQRHFFTPITEQDEPFFTSSMVNQHSPAEDEESPALEHAKLDGEKEMVKSPEIHVHEVGPDEETMLTSGHPASEIGSPGSLADQDFLGDAQRSHILALSPGSQESDSLPQGRDLSKQLETEPLSVDQPPIGTNATVEDSTKADEVDRGQAEKAQTSRKAVENDWFVSLRKEIRPPASGSRPSALTAKLRKQDAAPENPFAAFYAGVAARNTGEPSVKIDLYFPFAKLSGPAPLPPTPRAIISADRKRRMMKATVRKDATMEELIGFGMFCFIEEGWEPRFWENLSPPEMEVKLTTVGWALRIVEDGEVDDDFPAIDRTLTVGRFGSDEFAIVEASQTQVKQNQSAFRNIKRRISRTAVPTKTSNLTALSSLTSANLTPAATAPESLILAESTPLLASSALGKSLNAPMSNGIFLRVLMTPNDEVRYKTTLQVPSDMYLADVLEMLCRKRQLASPDQWALIVPDRDIVVPLDRTVESLQGTHDLALVKRSTLGIKGVSGALTGRSTNPNASIFNKRQSESAQPKYSTMQDVASVYKSWTVTRKTPMFVGRHEQRSLTLDGDWIHIMPLDVRAFQTRAASFHISLVTSCDISSKGLHIFKLIVWRDVPREMKRYDFEAETPKEANEIVGEIKALMRRHSAEKQRG